MKINQLRYYNCAGVKSLEISPGSITVFRGQNGSGKSSSLKGLRSLFPSSNRVNFGTLLPDDAETGEVVAWCDDDLVIRRELNHSDTAAGSPLSVKRGKWSAKGQGALDYLSERFDAYSVNAERFLYANKEDRLKVLLSAMPFQLDEEKFRSILPEGFKEFVLDKEAHPLEVIDTIRKRVYDERKDTNTKVREKTATAKQMVAEFPAPIATDELERQIKNREQDRDTLEEAKLGKLDVARIAKDTTIATATKHRDTSKKTKQVEIQAKIDALNEELRISEREQDRIFEAVRTSAERDYADVMALAEIEFGDKIAEAKEALVALRKTRDTERTYQATRQIAVKMEDEASELQKVSDYLDAGLDAIDQFKIDLLANLPIKGVEIKDGLVYIEKELWDHCPESRIAKLAVQVGIAKAGNSGIVVIDGLEKLTESSFNAFVKELEGYEGQIFMARATDEPFTVETHL